MMLFEKLNPKDQTPRTKQLFNDMAKLSEETRVFFEELEKENPGYIEYINSADHLDDV